MFWSSFGLFALAWAGQFFGHHLEGQKPAFLEDLQFPLPSQPGMVGERDASSGCRGLLHGHDDPGAGDRRCFVYLEALH